MVLSTSCCLMNTRTGMQMIIMCMTFHRHHLKSSTALLSAGAGRVLITTTINKKGLLVDYLFSPRFRNRIESFA